MFDIGFFELALIGVVLLVVMGPERLPEVARQIAFVVRKARNWVFAIKSEMNLSDDPMMQELKKAKNELNDLGRDMRQIGDDFAQEASKLNDKVNIKPETSKPNKKITKPKGVKKASKKKVTKKKAAKKQSVKKSVAKKVTRKTTKKVAKKAVKKATKKTAKKKGAR